MRRTVPWSLPLLLLVTGCGSETPTEAIPTWHQDVAPIVIERCSGCHTDGGISPFALQTYEDASNFASAILAAVEDRSMPPFLAQQTESCTPRLPWQADLTLRDEEIDLVRRWVEADAPEGDPSTAAPVADPIQAVLEREDVVLTLPEPITVDGEDDIHTCLLLDPGLEEDGHVIGRLITSGNEAVLHHVVSYLVKPGYDDDGNLQSQEELEAAIQAEVGAGINDRYDCFGGPNLDTVETEIVDAWAPGGLPNLAPEGSGQPISKDDLVLLDIHYHPTGDGPEIDADTRLSLMLAEDRPPLISQTILLGNFGERFESEFGIGELVAQPGESVNEFLIPAGASAHVEEMTWEWILPPGLDLMVYGAGTHMHYVGRDMTVELEYAADSSQDECLIQTPAWDFNWQRGYAYDAPQDQLPVMSNGDVLRMKCTFDNSMANPYLVEALDEQGLDAPVDVALGEDTLDEMCLAALSILYLNFE